MVKAHKIFLEDHCASAIHTNKVICDILWSCVEYIVETNETESNEEFNKLIELDTNNFAMDICEFGAENELPMQFGSNKKRKQNNKSNNKKRNKKAKTKKFIVNSIYEPFDSYHNLPRTSFPNQENLYMYKNFEENNLLPCEVIGNSYEINYVKIRILDVNNPKNIINCHRNQLKSINIDNLEFLQNLRFTTNIHMNPPKELDIHQKYWDQRYRLFLLYDHNIYLDNESWYSITPEIISDYIVKRCNDLLYKYSFNLHNNNQIRKLSSCIILDLFCGCGGNVISFAKTNAIVLCNDIDPIKLANCQ